MASLSIYRLSRTKKDCEAEVLALREEARRSEFTWEVKLRRKASGWVGVVARDGWQR